MADDSPKLTDVDEPKQLKTGIAELDEVLSGKGPRRDLHIFVGAPKENLRHRAMSEALEKGATATLDFEMDDPPDKAITPKPGS